MNVDKERKNKFLEQNVLADGTSLITFIKSAFAYLEIWMNYELWINWIWITNKKLGYLSSSKICSIVVFQKFVVGALRDLVPVVQLKKVEQHPWTSVTFSKFAGYKASHLFSPMSSLLKPSFQECKWII